MKNSHVIKVVVNDMFLVIMYHHLCKWHNMYEGFFKMHVLVFILRDFTHFHLTEHRKIRRSTYQQIYLCFPRNINCYDSGPRIVLGNFPTPFIM